MSAVDTAKNLIKSAAEASVKKGREVYAEHSGPAEPPGPVSVTILVSETVVRSLWTDMPQLSTVLGDLATVRRDAAGDIAWTAPAIAGDVEWTTEIVEDADSIRFVQKNSPDTDVVRVLFRPAPNDLGTEVSLELALPLPDLVAKTAAFTILYRSRALLQTGEIPTLRPLPAARPGTR